MNRAKAEIIEKELLAQMPVLSARYIKWGENCPDQETGFIIKDEDKYIAQISQRPLIGMRAGLIGIDQIYPVYPVVVILFISHSYYETWWNYHQIGGGEEYFKDLATQDLIMLHLYNQEGERKRSIRVTNGLKQGFSQYLEILRKTTPWPMEAFDKAKEELYTIYPTAGHLWDAIGKSKEVSEERR